MLMARRMNTNITAKAMSSPLFIVLINIWIRFYDCVNYMYWYIEWEIKRKDRLSVKSQHWWKIYKAYKFFIPLLYPNKIKYFWYVLSLSRFQTVLWHGLYKQRESFCLRNRIRKARLLLCLGIVSCSFSLGKPLFPLW